jgi:hypothetical protein
MKLCKWKRIESGSICFSTGCGHDYYYGEDGSETHPSRVVNFCCYCGKPMSKRAAKLKVNNVAPNRLR